MSDPIKHECGIAFIRLLKPLDYYKRKYGSALWGLNKMYLLMEKQHNRGQDGVGVASIKLNMQPGEQYIHRERSIEVNPIADVFSKVNNRISAAKDRADYADTADWQKKFLPFAGELYLGHLRYGTYGKNSIESCHPFLRENNWLSRNLVMAGNFNLTNVDELFQLLTSIGQHPVEKSDTVTMLEKIGHYLDKENERLFRQFKKDGRNKKEIAALIARDLDIQNILTEACEQWDGGFCIAGMIGHGDAFVLRDPWGIRPAFYYQDDEIVVVASERPVIQTAFNVPGAEVKEIEPGHAVVVKKNGQFDMVKYREPQKKLPCSFERIYFSRGSDSDIYKERKELGAKLRPAVLKEIDGDLENTVFSFIPNTAEASFYGLMGELDHYHMAQIKEQLMSVKEGEAITEDMIDRMLALRPRREKVAIKDAKLRTFISDDSVRDDLAAHVYDITYNSVKPSQDNLVVIDDSIVRGTTLRQSIFRILDRLQPKKIVVVSSAPQIRYPDCYGIDMAKLGDFIAFRAAIALLKENFQDHLIDEVYRKCKAQAALPDKDVVNYVKEIYAPFTAEQISRKITELLKPDEVKAECSIIYQSIEGLHAACPEHKGDWYFTGDYPTPGGNRVVNRAFINFVENRNERAY